MEGITVGRIANKESLAEEILVKVAAALLNDLKGDMCQPSEELYAGLNGLIANLIS